MRRALAVGNEGEQLAPLVEGRRRSVLRSLPSQTRRKKSGYSATDRPSLVKFARAQVAVTISVGGP